MSAQARRRRRAAAVLAALLVLALGADAAGRALRPGVLGEAAALASAGTDVPELPSADQAGELAGGSREPTPLPEGFAEEVMATEGFGNVRASTDGQVVGFETAEAPEQAFATARKALCGRGWAAVPSGDDAGGSFVKEAGRYSWVYVSCMRVGETTCVVVQCAATEGKD